MEVAWSALLLPAILATVLVFVASSLIHMVIQWHKPDYGKLSNEDEVRAVLRKGSVRPGQYITPHCKDSKDAASPELAAKFVEGPNFVMWVKPNGAVQLGPFLGKWVIYTLIVSLVAGYVGRSVLPVGASYLQVFQVIGASAWLAYSWQGPSDSIWKGKPWIATCRDMVDGLVYASLTAGAFGWLWPK